MKIDQLIFAKEIYPRHRDQNLDNEIKPDVENIEKIKDVLEMKGKIDHQITYNKKTMHIIDGTHLFQAMRELGWKDVPKEYLNEIEIPVEAEMWEAAKMNAAHGKALTRNEIKAIFLLYHDSKKRMVYRSLEHFSKDFNVPVNTLRNWIQSDRGNLDKHSTDQSNSSGSDGSGTEVLEDLQQTKKELEKTKIKLDEANKRVEEFEIKWNTICPTHKRVISSCKDCGKR